MGFDQIASYYDTMYVNSDAYKKEVQIFHLVGKGTEIQEYKNEQEISLFTEKEYRDAIAESGFELLKRLSPEEFRMGAFICRKSL